MQGHARLESETVLSVRRPQCGPWFHRRRIVATPLHTGVPPRPVDSQPMSRIYLPHRSHPFDDGRRMERERRPIRAAACNKRGPPIFIAASSLIKKKVARDAMNFDCEYWRGIDRLRDRGNIELSDSKQEAISSVK